MFRTVVGVMAAGAIAWGASVSAFGEDDFPIVGSYLKDQVCRGDSSDPFDLKVKISRRQIESNMGQCSILGFQRQGKTTFVQVECKVPGDQVILGDVSFTLRDDRALDFDDQYHTSPAVLYRCGK
ncbi:MAG: hypothetical protein QOI12_1950 [Alphaproteobacteria bacterium]|nr:hypothetical protein [Alphaproteobacteria bacterium]